MSYLDPQGRQWYGWAAFKEDLRKELKEDLRKELVEKVLEELWKGSGQAMMREELKRLAIESFIEVLKEMGY